MNLASPDATDKSVGPVAIVAAASYPNTVAVVARVKVGVPLPDALSGTMVVNNGRMNDG
jgi:hypothetical protein